MVSCLFIFVMVWTIPGNILSRAFCKFGWNTRVHVSLYELILCKKVAHDRDPVNNITHVSCLKVLGVTLQSNHRFSEHTKVKLKEANRCLYVIRCLRKEGYHQPDVVYVYRSIILPQLTYGLPLYASSTPELTTVQNFLQRCFKRKYVLYQIGIMMCWRGRSHHSLFKKISSMSGHPLYPLVPKMKESSVCLGIPSSQLPRVNTQHFKSSVF